MTPYKRLFHTLCLLRNVITFIKMVHKLPIMPVVNQANYELQPVFYKDLGKAYFSVLINENNTANKDFILSGGEPITLREMLRIIGFKLDKKVRFLSFPFWFGYACAWLLWKCLTANPWSRRRK